ncbi:MAG: urate hydroxylase PuuD [Deltaproteobacteria bacterium]|nr:urate hydroxylase PuuD [Deltaproteobacteria bacterium]
MGAHTWAEAFFRWIHVVAGVLWIGHLYFFNWVNGPLQKVLDGETKKKVNPELLPRALYFFRWGAAFTWVTGILLIMMVYYMYPSAMMVTEGGNAGVAIAAGAAVVLVLPFAYDAIWKTGLAKNEEMLVVITYVIVVGIMAGLTYGLGMPGRAIYIHIGSMFGTSMAFNVWFRIWPNQRKIIAAVKEGTPPDAALVALAGLRSKHNTYMSVPLIFAMISNHYPNMYGGQLAWVWMTVVIGLAWAITKHLYTISGKPAASAF